MTSEPLETEAAPAQEGAGPPVVLPAAVRARVVELVSAALGSMAAEHLPAPLKRVASFAPQRRARLAGDQIAAVLETDDAFRGHVAVQARVALGEVASALESGTTPGAANPVEVAAAAYLLRPENWRAVLDEAAAALLRPPAPDTRRLEDQVARLTDRLASAQSDLQQEKARTKERVDRLKAENTELRRRLGETRQRLKEATTGLDEATAERSRVEAEVAAAAATADAELRRLRARLSELEADLVTARRTERAAKVGENARARLLVDALVDAATGLRRELGLPAVDRLPADTVEAHLAEEGARASSGRRSLPVGDPALLEELLRLPKAHLVVDGYNVTKNALPEVSLERQRDRLLQGLAALVSRTRAEVTVVFDAAETQTRPPVSAPRGVRVLFSQYGVIADDVIRDLVAAEPPGRSVVVATSDRAVERDVVAAGFRVVSAEALGALVLRARG